MNGSGTRRIAFWIALPSARRYPPEVVAMAVKNTPARRAGTVDEVAASILFLASPGAQFITGATLYIDGAQRLLGDTWMLPDD